MIESLGLTAKIKLMNPEGKIPVQATVGSAGFDCFATEIIQEKPDVVLVKLGFAISFPPIYRLMFVPRSSLTKTEWLIQNSPGIGDSDYRGEYQMRFRAFPIATTEKNFLPENLTSNGLYYPEFPYKAGDRVCQMYFAPVLPTVIEQVDELGETERGSGGFGSTGK
jgi:dUTP pyrophosphatase